MEAVVQNFEVATLPHMKAAYNLARWLTRNDKDAEDVVQEAFLRAFRHFSTFHGGDPRPWLLAIVRNTCYSWMRRNRALGLHDVLDEETQSSEQDDLNPEMILLKEESHDLLRLALEELPPEFRELIVLREFEELSYKQIAKVATIPMGTVMSRLARARRRLQQILLRHRNDQLPEEVKIGTM